MVIALLVMEIQMEQSQQLPLVVMDQLAINGQLEIVIQYLQIYLLDLMLLQLLILLDAH